MSKEIAGQPIRKLVVMHQLSISDPQLDKCQIVDNNQAQYQQQSIGLGISGCRSATLNSSEVESLKNPFENKYRSKEANEVMYWIAAKADTTIERFLLLHRLLLLLPNRPVDEKGRPRPRGHVYRERFTTRTSHPIPSRVGKFETIFSKLRNEIAHVRPNTNPIQTRGEIDRYLDDFAEIVSKAI
jgi:hypothetical protein